MSELLNKKLKSQIKNKIKKININDKLQCLEIASSVHKHIRKIIKKNISVGTDTFDIVTNIENAIKYYLNDNICDISTDNGKKINAGIAFPVGISINHVAAHDSPFSKGIKINFNDVVKIDFGVHINGYIIDSAFTMTFNSNYQPLIDASKEGTYIGIKNSGVDVRISELGEKIQEVIESYECNIDGKIIPIKSCQHIGGHNIDQYRIHAGKLVYGVKNNCKDIMLEGELYAIETYATTGTGDLKLDSNMDCSHYSLNYDRQYYSPKFTFKNSHILLNKIKSEYNTLAFNKRWIKEWNTQPSLTGYINELVKTGIVNAYPPIVDIKNSKISQLEHTIYIDAKSIKIISNSDDY
jgi:methionyl aminopeptidase